LNGVSCILNREKIAAVGINRPERRGGKGIVTTGYSVQIGARLVRRERLMGEVGIREQAKRLLLIKVNVELVVDLKEAIPGCVLDECRLNLISGRLM
jgi:hypothetical protein